jgi:cytochrome c oxidase subunit 3
MTISLVVLSLLMAVIVWWLFRQTINVQPWVAETSTGTVEDAGQSRPAVKTALWVFLGVVASLFALFISAYAMRIHFLDWTPLPQPRLLTLNTVVLILASIALQWAVRCARVGDMDGVRTGLAAGGVLTIAFLIGQLAVWKQLHEAGFALATSAATAFFYLLTAVHGLHMVGGLWAWGRTASRAWKVRDPAEVRLSIELCATYWHFLLGVWIIVFTVLVSSYLGLSICAPSVSL